MYRTVMIAVAFHALDFLTGLIQAIKNKDIESSKMRDGLFKKVGYILCYILAALIDTQSANVGINLGVEVLPIICAYTVTTEIVSIIENICKINPDLLPDKLIQLFRINKEN